jgi:hypothetical protein
MNDAYFFREEDFSNHKWTNRTLLRLRYRYYKSLFWNNENREFSQDILKWILSHVDDDDLKEKIFVLAAKIDLPHVCEEIPATFRFSACDEHNDDENCAICCEKHKDSVITECEHKFHEKCIRKWLHKKADCPLCRRHLPPDQQSPIFVEAVKANSLQCTEIIMRKMINYDVTFDQVEPPLNALHYTVAFGSEQEEMCKILLENGMAPLIEERNDSFTPLMRAIYQSKPVVVRCLIEHGADFQTGVMLPFNDNGDEKEYTPLEYALVNRLDNCNKSEEVYEIVRDFNRKIKSRITREQKQIAYDQNPNTIQN